MNIQIFGTKKSADTRKAQRYFQERRIKFQFVDLSQKGMSKGEFESVARVVGGQDSMIDENCGRGTVDQVAMTAEEQRRQVIGVRPVPLCL